MWDYIVKKWKTHNDYCVDAEPDEDCDIYIPYIGA